MNTPATAARRRLSRAERLILIGLAMIVAQTAFRIWSVSGSWFFADDFLFIGVEQAGQADASWIFGAHNVHVMPLGYLLVKPVVAAGAYAWWAAAVQIVVLQVLASLACWWMLRTLFGDRPGTVVALGFYLFSPLVVPGTLWWAAAINMLPHHIALFALIAAHTRYLQTRQTRWLGWAAFFLILGFASYAKMILAPLVLALLTLLYFAHGGLMQRLRRAVLDYAAAWRVYAMLTLAYLVYYFAVTESTPRPAWADIGRTVELTVLQSFGPALLGGPWRWTFDPAELFDDARQFADPSLAMIVASWIVLAVLGLWHHGRVRRGLWPLWILAPYVLLSAVINALGRSWAFGAAYSSMEVRYLADVAGIAALCLGLAIMPVRGAQTCIVARGVPTQRRRRERRLATTGLTLLVGSASLSSTLYVLPWHEDETMTQRVYVERVRTALHALDGPVEILDVGVPGAVWWDFEGDSHRVSRIFAAEAEFFAPVLEGTNVHLIDRAGRLRRAAPLQPARTAPGPAPECGYRIADARTEVPVDPLPDYAAWVFVHYYAGDFGRMRVQAGSRSSTTPVYPGLNTFVMRQEGAIDRVTFWPQADTTLCVDRIHVAELDDFPAAGDELRERDARPTDAEPLP